MLIKVVFIYFSCWLIHTFSDIHFYYDMKSLMPVSSSVKHVLDCDIYNFLRKWFYSTEIIGVY